MAGLQIKAMYLSFVVHVLGVAAAVMVLVWNIHFRGGLAWESSNKNLIFNGFNFLIPEIFDFFLSYYYVTLFRLSYKGYLTTIVMLLMFHMLVPGLRQLKPIYVQQVHPVLMLIGLIIMGGEAIISYKALPFKKAEKKLIHLILHAIALILGIIGIYMAFKNHNESGIANLYSLHSWIGIGIISLYGIQWVYGFLVFFYPGGSGDLRRESLPWHALFGMFVYILAVANSALGFLEKLTFMENSGTDKYGTEAFLVNFTAIVAILYGTFVILTALSRSPDEDNHSYSAI